MKKLRNVMRKCMASLLVLCMAAAPCVTEIGSVFAEPDTDTDIEPVACGNHKGDQSHPMKLQQGPHSLFFSCPEYKSIYGDDHEGRSCNNRLTLVDYEKLLDYLTERTYAGDGLQETNLTGLKFTLKGVDYEVLEHTKDKYRVLMLNRKAISK